MVTVLLVVQILIVVALVALILLQQNASDGLAGLGGGSAGGNGLMSARQSANMLTRATAILAGLFMLNSLVLAYIFVNEGRSSRSIAEQIEQSQAVEQSGEAASEATNKLESGEVESEKPAATSVPVAPAVPTVPEAE